MTELRHRQRSNPPPPYSFPPRNGHTGGGVMKRRTSLVALVATVAGMAGAAPASAHQSPAGCNNSALHLDLVRDHSVVRNGDTITYRAVVDNVGPLACDVSGINIRLQFPQPDGTP